MGLVRASPLVVDPTSLAEAGAAVGNATEGAGTRAVAALASAVAGLAGGPQAARNAILLVAPLAGPQVRPPVGQAKRKTGAARPSPKQERRVGASARLLLAVAASNHAEAGRVAEAARLVRTLARPVEVVRPIPVGLGHAPVLVPAVVPEAVAALSAEAAKRPVEGRVADVRPVPNHARP